MRGPDLLVGDHSTWAATVEHMGRSLVVVHRNEKRALVRRQAAAGYYQQRDSMGIEAYDAEQLLNEA